MDRKPRISIYNDFDHKHYFFVRDSKIPRGAFREWDWTEIGHRVAPLVVVTGLLGGLLAVWISS